VNVTGIWILFIFAGWSLKDSRLLSLHLIHQVFFFKEFSPSAVGGWKVFTAGTYIAIEFTVFITYPDNVIAILLISINADTLLRQFSSSLLQGRALRLLLLLCKYLYIFKLFICLFITVLIIVPFYLKATSLFGLTSCLPITNPPPPPPLPEKKEKKRERYKTKQTETERKEDPFTPLGFSPFANYNAWNFFYKCHGIWITHSDLGVVLIGR